MAKPPKPDEEQPAPSVRQEATWFRRWEVRVAWPFPSVQQVEERFEQLIRRRWTLGAGRGEAPPADVFVVGDELWVEVDLPGVDEDSVRAWLEGDVLCVEATRRAPPPAEGARPASVERPRGALHRRISLPCTPGAASLEVSLQGGVLRVRIRPEAAR